MYWRRSPSAIAAGRIGSPRLMKGPYRASTQGSSGGRHRRSADFEPDVEAGVTHMTDTSPQPIVATLKDVHGRFTYYRTRVYFPKGSTIFRWSCEQGGIYEPEVTAWLCRLAQPGKTFVDVGANIGLTSIPVLETVCHARVISFEPSPGSLP